MPKERRKDRATANGANLGFEEKLWAAADKLRGHMDAAEYKHVVLGLVFLKYISDAFEERRQRLLKETSDPKSEYYVREPEARYEVISDRLEARAGTLTADWERFMPWRTIEGDQVASRGTPELEVLIKGVFEKRRFLDLVRHFITLPSLASPARPSRPATAARRRSSATTSTSTISSGPWRMAPPSVSIMKGG